MSSILTLPLTKIHFTSEDDIVLYVNEWVDAKGIHNGEERSFELPHIVMLHIYDPWIEKSLYFTISTPETKALWLRFEESCLWLKRSQDGDEHLIGIDATSADGTLMLCVHRDHRVESVVISRFDSETSSHIDRLHIPHILCRHLFVEDVENLAELTFINTLAIKGCNSIESIKAFSRYHSLESLCIENANALIHLDLSPSLLSLRLAQCPVLLPALEQVPTLKRLSLNKTKTPNLEHLERIHTLRELVLSYIYNISHIHLDNFPELESFVLQDSKNMKEIRCDHPLHNLHRFILDSCFSLQHIPSACNMPNMNEISLRGMGAIQSIEWERFKHLKILSFGNPSYMVEPFDGTPKAQKLRFLDLFNDEVCLSSLEVLTVEGFIGCESLFRCSMPKLRKLTIDPATDFSSSLFSGVSFSLEYLTMTRVKREAKLTLPDDVSRLTYLMIQHAENLRDLTDISHCYNLKTLSLVDCPHVRSLQALRGLLKLTDLFILDIKVPASSLETAIALPNLKRLFISDINDLDVLNIGNMSQLRFLGILGCSNLQTLEVFDMPRLAELGVEGCESLESIRIQALDQLIHLDFCYTPALKRLYFDGSSKVEKIALERCPALRSIGGLENISVLRKLHLDQYNHLGEKTLQLIKSMHPQIDISYKVSMCIHDEDDELLNDT